MLKTAEWFEKTVQLKIQIQISFSFIYKHCKWCKHNGPAPPCKCNPYEPADDNECIVSMAHPNPFGHTIHNTIAARFSFWFSEIHGTTDTWAFPGWCLYIYRKIERMTKQNTRISNPIYDFSRGHFIVMFKVWFETKLTASSEHIDHGTYGRNQGSELLRQMSVYPGKCRRVWTNPSSSVEKVLKSRSRDGNVKIWVFFSRRYSVAMQGTHTSAERRWM